MGKCDCYRVEKKIVGWCNCNEPIFWSVFRCYGTKERDECSCGGDRTKCDFYPEIREKANKDVYIQEAISYFKYGIRHDVFSEPVITYAKMAVEALETQLSEKRQKNG